VAAESKLRILGNVKGKRILEIGCGGAQKSIALSRWRAEVFAVDLSRSQIDYGKKLARGEKAEVNLIVGDMKKIPFDNESFHIVVTAISLQYVPDLMATFADVNRVLLNYGNFVFSGMHPLSLGRLVRYRGEPAVVVADYFRRRMTHWTEKLPDGSKVHMHEYYRTLHDYFDALARSGFVIERYLELERLKKDALHNLAIEDIKKRREARQLYGLIKKVPCWFVLKARKDSH
jgi:ubiquinone/menaquinone biosynthesis C-methylase UbiE